MEYWFATDSDLDLLAEWNNQLICDEGYRNPVPVPALRERMRRWMEEGCKAVIFGPGAAPLAYALYWEDETEICLRQLFVRRTRRSEGIGREVMHILRTQVWPPRKHLTVEVLTNNLRAVTFWRSIGYRDHRLTLEMPSDSPGQ